VFGDVDFLSVCDNLCVDKLMNRIYLLGNGDVIWKNCM
jgi:hypothetical protein